MTQYVIVRINDKLIPEFQINYDSNNKVASRDSISQWSEVSIKPSQSLYLLISASLVLNSQVKIPSKNEEVIRQSIPFAVEEDLADELSENHFAYTQIEGAEFIVSTIKKSILNQLLESLKTESLKAEGLFSEIFTCPENSDARVMSVCYHSQNSVTRMANKGTTVNNKSLNTYLKLSKASQVKLFSESEVTSENDKVEVHQVANLALLQAQSLLETKNVNILQGEYNLDSKDKQTTSPWKKVIFLAAVLVISWLAININQLWQLGSEVDDLRKQQQQVLLSVIPNANQTQLNDPYAATMSKFKSYDNTSSASNTFISSLSYLGLTLQQHPQIRVDSIRLRESKFELNVQAYDVVSLNQFQATLEANAYSMRVRTGTRDTNKDGVNAILTMEVL